MALVTRWALHRRVPIRWYVAAGAALIVSASTLTATFVAYSLQRSAVEGRFTSTSVATAQAEARRLRIIARSAGQAGLDQAVQGDSGSPIVAAYVVLDDTGSRVAPDPCTDMLCPYFPGDSFNAARQRRGIQHWFDLEDRRLYAVLEPVPDTRYSLLIDFDFTPESGHLADLRSSLLRVAVIFVLGAIVIGTVLGTLATRPLVRAARAAVRFGEGELATRVPVRGGRELAQLAEQFNAMAHRLSSTIEALHLSQSLQRRFVADVSHELRTPLAAMVAAQGAVDEGRDTAQAARIQASQTRRLNRLVEDLLEISRFDAGRVAIDVEPLDLTDLCRDVVMHIDGATAVTVSGVGDTVITTDARRVHSIAHNLIVNAVHHGEAPVTVAIDGSVDPVTITVTDAGPGVPRWLRDTVFNRFVRGDASRTGMGTGLGLAIARENARIVGGAVELRADAPTSFVVRLPRTADGADTPSLGVTTDAAPGGADRPDAAPI